MWCCWPIGHAQSMQRRFALESFSYGPTALPPTTRPGKVRGRLTTKVLWEAVDVTMKIRTQGWTALKLGNKGRVGVRNILAPSLLPFCQNLTDTRYTAALTKSQYAWRVIRRGCALWFHRPKGLCVQLRMCGQQRSRCGARTALHIDSRVAATHGRTDRHMLPRRLL